MAPSPAQVRRPVLSWYDKHRRTLPWRAAPGETADPYLVWLSEIMLQQTTVATVGPYFERFRAAWPTVEALARASLDDVLTAWAGLGYYSRARNLHKCAQTIVQDYGGRFPSSEDALRALPGIGPYTAAAIAAIAFDRPAAPVDGNIERVLARLFCVTEPLPAVKPILRELAAQVAPKKRSGDFAQALMDIGALICTPRTPKCTSCPLSTKCAAHKTGVAAELPKRAKKKAKPTRRGLAFRALRSDGAILLRQRPPKGLLGAMWEVPTSEWSVSEDFPDDHKQSAPCNANWRVLAPRVKHTFTHFHLELLVYQAEISDGDGGQGVWVPSDELDKYAIPTVMKKVIEVDDKS